MVKIPAGVKHWHGAAKESWFTDVTLAVPAVNTSNEWLATVTDEYYAALD